MNTAIQTDKIRYGKCFAIPALIILSVFLMRPGFALYSSSWTVRFFTPELIGIFAGALLFLNPKRFIERVSGIPGFIRIAMLLMLSIGIWNYARNWNASFEHFGESLIYLSLPLLVFVYAEEFLKLLPPLMTYFWLWNAIFCIHQRVFLNVEMFGVTGNRNWTVALMVATAPMAFYCMAKLLMMLKMKRWLAFMFAGIVVGLLSLWIFADIASRGASVSTACALLLFVILSIGKKYRRPILLGLSVLFIFTVVIIATLGIDKLANVMVNDERAIITLGVFDMVMVRPILGYGTSAFEQEYLTYRPMEYFLHPHCAVRTDHPHNHFLFIMAGFGLVGLITWFVLLFNPLWKFICSYDDEKSVYLKLMFYSLATLLIHACFDLILERGPTNVLALILIGILWSHAWTPSLLKNSEAENTTPFILGMSARIAMLLCGVAVLCCFSISLGRTVHTELLLHNARLLQMKYGNNAAPAMFWKIAMTSTDAHTIYQSAKRVMNSWQDYSALLYLADRLKEKSNIPDYAHINSYIGMALMNQGRYQEALPYYERETQIFPLLLIPRVNISTIYLNLGKYEELMLMQHQIREIMKLRNITDEDIEIIMKNPDYDLRPWDITSHSNVDTREKN